MYVFLNPPRGRKGGFSFRLTIGLQEQQSVLSPSLLSLGNICFSPRICSPVFGAEDLVESRVDIPTDLISFRGIGAFENSETGLAEKIVHTFDRASFEFGEEEIGPYWKGLLW